jgi:hypothetical protein
MKRSKFTDEQILAIVNEGEAGQKVTIGNIEGSSKSTERPFSDAPVPPFFPPFRPPGGTATLVHRQSTGETRSHE